MIYYWAIVLALCFGCFRLSVIFSAVVSVLRRCTITVLLHNTEATHPLLENKSLSIGLAIYYWTIVQALCFVWFRLSAIFSVVVSVLRRSTIIVLLYDMEATHCPFHGNYSCTVHAWTVPTDTYHLPRDVELFDPPRPKGPYPSGDGHYWRGAGSFMKSIMIWITLLTIWYKLNYYYNMSECLD